ncbi:MAG: hypothetical protein ACI97A_003713 [Planctomycetota bacterium]|jgi:uncharacterized protein YyaL (SSP411 family)
MIRNPAFVVITIFLALFFSCAPEPDAPQPTPTPPPAKKPAKQAAKEAAESPTTAPTKRKANRLSKEKSPYLLQHQFNPVDWWPWGEAAFAEAKKRDVPVFLSIGYSTCHWCHVMEHESFEDKDIAAYMNANFVCIKLDREERPDVDAVYMRVIQLLTQRGGWPASLFLTPDKLAFFGGTYFPPVEFQGLLKNVVREWKENRVGQIQNSKRLLERIASFERKPKGTKLPDPSVVSKTVDFEKGKFDKVEGGFGAAPKFPRTSVYETLMRSADKDAHKISFFSLRKMAHGGIYDHVGGGIHRYSTDAQWLVPHFEKMLYDQALVAETYLDAGLLSRDRFFFDVARDILDCVVRDFTSENGGLYCAYDADSGGVEGSYYVWTKKELDALFEGKERALLDSRFTVKAEGNFSLENMEIVTILAARQEWPQVAKDLELSVPETLKIWAQVRKTMHSTRAKRVAPGLDNKILTGWIGLGISALARGGRILSSQEFVGHAIKAADFVLNNLRLEDGRFLRRWCDGEAAFAGTLQDYSYFGLGLLDLFEATGDVKWIKEAAALGHIMIKEFSAPNGALYDSPDAKDLVVRLQDAYDGARPSANGKSCLFLLRLNEFTGDKKFLTAGDGILKVFQGTVEQSPWYYPVLVRCTQIRATGMREIVVIGNPQAKDMNELLSYLNSTWLPDSILCFVDDATAKENGKLIPLLAQRTSSEGNAVTYVCRAGTCKLPAKSLEELKKRLNE